MIDIPYHKMTKTVEVYNPVNGRDEDRRPTIVWDEHFKTRGRLTSKKGSEQVNGEGNSHVATKTLHIRYRRDKDLTRSMKVVVNKVEYEVLDVTNVNDENKLWELSLRKVEV